MYHSVMGRITVADAGCLKSPRPRSATKKTSLASTPTCQSMPTAFCTRWVVFPVASPCTSKTGCCRTEYNLFEIMRTQIKAKDKLPTGKAKIEVQTTYVERRPAGPLKVVLKVNGKEVASGVVPVSAPLIFTANDCLDFGIDLGSPVGIEYYDLAPSNSMARSKVRTCNT